MKKIVMTVMVAALGVPSFAGSGVGKIKLYNTGFSGLSTYADGDLDPHWRVKRSVDVIDGPTYTLGNSIANWGSEWEPNTADSKWIGTTATSTQTGDPGNYAYSQIFTLSGQDPLSATISGRWTGDDSLVDILLNGKSLGTDGEGAGTVDSAWRQWHDFKIAPGNARFKDGINEISFVVYNRDNFLEGARVELSGSASLAQPVPEPFTMGLMGLGAAAALRRRKRS